MNQNELIDVMVFVCSDGTRKVFSSKIFPWVSAVVGALAGNKIDSISFGEVNSKGEVQWEKNFTATREDAT